MSIIKCSKCGKEIDSSVLYCPFCGEKNASAGFYSYKGDPQNGAQPTNPISAVAKTVKSGALNPKKWSKKAIIIAGVVAVALILVIIIVSGGNPTNAIIGTWINDHDRIGFTKEGVYYEYENSSLLSGHNIAGTYTIDGDEILIMISELGITEVREYEFSVSDDVLTMIDKAGGEAVLFYREGSKQIPTVDDKIPDEIVIERLKELLEENGYNPDTLKVLSQKSEVEKNTSREYEFEIEIEDGNDGLVKYTVHIELRFNWLYEEHEWQGDIRRLDKPYNREWTKNLIGEHTCTIESENRYTLKIDDDFIGVLTATQEDTGEAFDYVPVDFKSIMTKKNENNSSLEIPVYTNENDYYASWYIRYYDNALQLCLKKGPWGFLEPYATFEKIK